VTWRESIDALLWLYADFGFDPEYASKAVIEQRYVVLGAHKTRYAVKLLGSDWWWCYEADEQGTLYDAGGRAKGTKDFARTRIAAGAPQAQKWCQGLA
jgi:hypothetical protein